MNMYAKLYDNGNSLLVGLIDAIKGEYFCQSEWLKYKIMELGPTRAKEELKKRMFWED